MRELDAVTIWIRENLREPLADSPSLVIAMAAARLINRPETLEKLKSLILKHGWHKDCEAIMREVAAEGEPITNGAYMITTPMGMDKAAGISFILEMMKSDGDCENFISLNYMSQWLMKFPRVGTFIAAQIVADSKMVPRFRDCPDWNTFALSGPGSRRGLNHVYGRPFDAPMEESEWHEKMLALRVELNKFLAGLGWDQVDAQDSQNCCCEAQKYFRMKNLGMEPKQIYRPKLEPAIKPTGQAQLF